MLLYELTKQELFGDMHMYSDTPVLENGCVQIQSSATISPVATQKGIFA